MRKMNKLWMLALVAAMLVTGALSEQYRTANAETAASSGLEMETAPAVEVAEGIDWDASLEESVSRLARSNAVCHYGEENGRMGAHVTAENMEICGYPAEQLNLYFHDDVLCMGVYTLEAECSPLTFAMLSTELQQRFGEPASWDADGFRFGGCSALWTSALGLNGGESSGNWWQKATEWVGWLSDSSITGYRKWTVGDHTRVVLVYAEANTFLGEDFIQVVFLNLHPNKRFGALEGAALDAMLGN